MKAFTQYQYQSSNISTNSFRLLNMLEGSQGHILTHFRKNRNHGTPRKSGFFQKKRPKEGDRVALHHFHERVDESPRQDENFEPSGAPVAFFVSEIWPFEADFSARSDST